MSLSSETSGIYFLVRDEQIVYVGQSTNIAKRLRTHSFTRTLLFDYVIWYYVAIDDLAQVEYFWIGLLWPEYNFSGRLRTTVPVLKSLSSVFSPAEVRRLQTIQREIRDLAINSLKRETNQDKVFVEQLSAVESYHTERSLQGKPSKTQVRYWQSAIFTRRAGGNWWMQVQHAGRRGKLSLATPIKAAAAAKARDIYLSILANGWNDTNKELVAK